AEDGIRDFHVTGVQTCALPIYALRKGHLAGYAVSGDILPGRIGNSVGGYGKPARRPRTLKQNSCQGAKAAETAGSAGRTDRRVGHSAERLARFAKVRRFAPRFSTPRGAALRPSDEEGREPGAASVRLRSRRALGGYGNANTNTAARLSSAGSSGVMRRDVIAFREGPVVTATYCFPSTANVIGKPLTGPPMFVSHSTSPV